MAQYGEFHHSVIMLQSILIKQELNWYDNE